MINVSGKCLIGYVTGKVTENTGESTVVILPSAPLQQPSSIDDIGSRLHLAGKGAMGSDE